MIERVIRQQILKELEENSVFDSRLLDLFKKQSEELEEEFPYGIDPEIYSLLSTNRNRELISHELQSKLRNTVVGFFGLSVGSHAAVSWMMESRASTIKISDPDTVDATNLNRLRTGWSSVGEEKVEILKNELNGLNPFSRILSTNKTDKASVRELFEGDFPLNFVVEEIDEIGGKLLIRSLCKEKKIPLISATDVGDNVVVDIERYDLHEDQQFFNGRVENINNIDFASLSPVGRIKLVMQIVGFEACSEEMIDSLLSIGKSIKTWPQLGATATIAGGVITTVIKKIISGEFIDSGRYIVSIDSLFSDPKDRESKNARREEKIKKFKAIIGME